jgi:hypothetical protein
MFCSLCYYDFSSHHMHSFTNQSNYIDTLTQFQPERNWMWYSDFTATSILLGKLCVGNHNDTYTQVAQKRAKKYIILVFVGTYSFWNRALILIKLIYCPKKHVYSYIRQMQEMLSFYIQSEIIFLFVLLNNWPNKNISNKSCILIRCFVLYTNYVFDERSETRRIQICVS